MSTMSPNSETLDLYGGDRPWDAAQWQTSDDRVRGGSSRSHLTVLDPRLARFHGYLDTKTLGGAGFASQHSAGELHLDLSGCSGLVLSVAGPSADGLAAAAADASKRFAVTLKDQLPGERPDGRAKSGISWEADFTWGPQDGCAQIFLPWSDFKATYRGRDKPDAEPLDLSAIKRVGLMMRSFFGEQDGDFQIDLHGIGARRTASDSPGLGGVGQPTANHDDDDDEDDDDLEMQKHKAATRQQQHGAESRWWSRLLCGLL